MVKATILIDNQCDINNPCLQSEHGLCVLVETRDLRILCDAGASGSFFDNAGKLGIDLSNLDMVVISHGHNDHTGGLPRLLAENHTTPVYASRHIFHQFTSTRRGRERDISAPSSLTLDYRHRFQLLDGSRWLNRQVALVACDIASTPRPEGNCHLTCDNVPDIFRHELSLAIVDDDSLIIFSPCSHCGAVNIIEASRRFTGIDKVKAFVGGLHFVDGPDVEAEVERFARDVSHYCPETTIYTGHCTCVVAQNLLLAKLPSTKIFSTGLAFVL